MGRGGNIRSSRSRSSGSRSSSSRRSSPRFSSELKGVGSFRLRGSSSYRSYRLGGGNSSGIFLICAILIFVLIVVVLVWFSGYNGVSITKSTVNREPLSKDSVIETEYYKDELGWISSGTKVIESMKYFYQKTGVQAVLYLTSNVKGNNYPSPEDTDALAVELYNKAFKDEAHFLLVFQEYDDEWTMGYATGSQAKTVVDREAADIIMDYVEANYYDESLSEDEMFALAFRKSADRIMTVTKSPIGIIVASLSTVVVVCVAFLWWRKRIKARKEEQERVQRMLDTPLDTFGSTTDME